MTARALARTASQAGLSWTARTVAARRLELRVEGLHHLPPRGPVLLAVRHVHHLWDGVALLASTPRPVHLLVGLDWVGTPLLRRAMETLTTAAGWPVVVRREGLDPRGRTRAAGPESAYRAEEQRVYLRRALRDVLALLEEGRAVAIFPQGFPLVDPHLTLGRKASFRPFRPGLAGFAAAARRRLGREVPIVPVGLSYADASGRLVFGTSDREGSVREEDPRRLVARLHFGAPLSSEERRSRDALLRAAEARVRALSGVAHRA